MRRSATLLTAALALSAGAGAAAPRLVPDLPDPLVAEAYAMAARQNVLAAVNPGIFPGYWCVCADGEGFGRGNSYPALDGHQLADALLWLGQTETVRLNWDYVRGFQRENGQLPFAILPALAGQDIGPEDSRAPVDANGGLYRHWVPDDPLRALGYPTYIQNADVYYRRTGDRAWLEANLPSVNRAGDFLAALMSPEDALGGAGYYVERPTRVECDGVTQCHGVDAFRRLAALNRNVGHEDAARRYEQLADRVLACFQSRFWGDGQFVEYIHPARGPIAAHGLTDVDWCALAFGCATAEQQAVVWPKLKDAEGFRYGGMPTAIATNPEHYEDWEFSYGDRMDLAAMGRVWYIECRARARMGDAVGLMEGLRRVCEAGRDHGWYWRERYGADGGYGAEKYCEYPANLIRAVQRFVLGVEPGVENTLRLDPCVPEAWWEAGFGQYLVWRGHHLDYRFEKGVFTATYYGPGGLTLFLGKGDGNYVLLDEFEEQAPAAIRRELP